MCIGYLQVTREIPGLNTVSSSDRRTTLFLYAPSALIQSIGSLVMMWAYENFWRVAMTVKMKRHGAKDRREEKGVGNVGQG